jgi:hypothetical protein
VPDNDNVHNLDDYRKPEPYGDPPELRFSTNQIILLVVGLSLLVGSVATLALIVLLFG